MRYLLPTCFQPMPNFNKYNTSYLPLVSFKILKKIKYCDSSDYEIEFFLQIIFALHTHLPPSTQPHPNPGTTMNPPKQSILPSRREAIAPAGDTCQRNEIRYVIYREICTKCEQTLPGDAMEEKFWRIKG